MQDLKAVTKGVMKRQEGAQELAVKLAKLLLEKGKELELDLGSQENRKQLVAAFLEAAVALNARIPDEEDRMSLFELQMTLAGALMGHRDVQDLITEAKGNLEVLELEALWEKKNGGNPPLSTS